MLHVHVTSADRMCAEQGNGHHHGCGDIADWVSGSHWRDYSGERHYMLELPCDCKRGPSVSSSMTRYVAFNMCLQGDQLIATSGVTYGRIDDYGGAAVRNQQQIVRMSVIGEVGCNSPFASAHHLTIQHMASMRLRRHQRCALCDVASVRLQTMKTVSAAIGSHPGHIPVTLEFQKCDPVSAVSQ
jgi:hypothetical protein